MAPGDPDHAVGKPLQRLMGEVATLRAKSEELSSQITELNDSDDAEEEEEKADVEPEEKESNIEESKEKEEFEEEKELEEESQNEEAEEKVTESDDRDEDSVRFI